MRKRNYKTNSRTHRETPKVCGSPQTQGYVHQSVASCKLFSKGWLQSRTTLLHAHLWFTLQELLTEYSFILTTGFNEHFFPKHKDTSQSLYLCSKYQDNHSPLSLRQNTVFLYLCSISLNIYVHYQ